MALDKGTFRKLLTTGKPILLDGATGTLLIQETGVQNNILWASGLNLDDPLLVTRILHDYIDAGADIITTNTFRTNYLAYDRAGIKTDYAAFVRAGVSPAIAARHDHPRILIAGSNAPAEDCYQAERTISEGQLRKNHALHISALVQSGVDFILNETQSHLDEIEIICEYCDRIAVPYIMSFYVTGELRLFSGETIQEALEKLAAYEIDAVCINCVSPGLFGSLMSKVSLPPRWGFYLNCGKGNI